MTIHQIPRSFDLPGEVSLAPGTKDLPEVVMMRAILVIADLLCSLD